MGIHLNMGLRDQVRETPYVIHSIQFSEGYRD